MSERTNEQEKQGTHTPGPWSVHNDWPFVIVPDGHKRRSIGGSVHEKDDRESYAIQIADAAFNKYGTFAHEIPKEQAKANARLIAAAPEMFAALDSLTRWLNAHHESSDEFYIQSMEQARAAIAKATGKD